MEKMLTFKWREMAGRFLLSHNFTMQSKPIPVGELQSYLEEFGREMLGYFERTTEHYRKLASDALNVSPTPLRHRCTDCENFSLMDGTLQHRPDCTMGDTAVEIVQTDRDYYKAAYARKIEEVDGLCRRLVEISEICQSAVGENATEEVTEELVMRIWETAAKRRTNL